MPCESFSTAVEADALGAAAGLLLAAVFLLALLRVAFLRAGRFVVFAAVPSPSVAGLAEAAGGEAASALSVLAGFAASSVLAGLLSAGFDSGLAAALGLLSTGCASVGLLATGLLSAGFDSALVVSAGFCTGFAASTGALASCVCVVAGGASRFGALTAAAGLLPDCSVATGVSLDCGC